MDKNISFHELINSDPFFKAQKQWLAYNLDAEDLKLPLVEHCFGQGEAIITAFQKWKELSNAGKYQSFSIYSAEEIAKDPKKGAVRLLHFKGDENSPCCIVCPGGAYMDCVLWGEGILAATNLAEHNINAFVLFYRANESELFPKPVEDLAQAIRFIIKNADTLQVSIDNYAIAGFSAGGHLAGTWGTLKYGYQKYDLPRPTALLLGYPSIGVEFMYDKCQSDTWNPIGQAADDLFFRCIAGEEYTRDKLMENSIAENITSEYPPCYIVHAKDDDLVDFESTLKYVECLKKHNILYKKEFSDFGGHGFVLGRNTLFDGWFDRAIDFWKQCIK